MLVEVTIYSIQRECILVVKMKLDLGTWSTMESSKSVRPSSIVQKQGHITLWLPNTKDFLICRTFAHID